ncbi:MAG: hypothetical protein IT371_06170 [Deltaproteobacteria bacterium]|nr:hypothetical protein [Deltaproteobacteria bacterium]
MKPGRLRNLSVLASSLLAAACGLEGELPREESLDRVPAGCATPSVAIPATQVRGERAGALWSTTQLFSHPVVQQPRDRTGCVLGGHVSARKDEVTQFAAAPLGLLAHNFLAGASFLTMRLGDRVRLTLANQGAGHTPTAFSVAEVRDLQALTPTSATSDFVDLGSGKRLTAAELFAEVYTSGERVVLQTCIAKGAELSWGRRFVIGTPLPCRTASDCATGELCFSHDGCGEVGFCVARPSSCPDAWAPVRGCNGRRYSSECEAFRAGVSVRAPDEPKFVQ